MNYTFFKKKGKCQNCREEEELGEVEFKGKNKLWCEMCVEGRKIEENK